MESSITFIINGAASSGVKQGLTYLM